MPRYRPTFAFEWNRPYFPRRVRPRYHDPYSYPMWRPPYPYRYDWPGLRYDWPHPYYPLKHEYLYATPPLGAIRSNPLAAGMQLGMLGAASGLGYAALHRAIRLHAGNRQPVSVVKPLLIGTLIGSALGVVSSLAMGKKQPQPTPRTWYDISDTIHKDIHGFPRYGQPFSDMPKPWEKQNKYHGLTNVVGLEKQAIAITAGLLLSALFAGMGAVGAAGQGRKAYKAFKAGKRKAGVRHALGAGAEALMALPLVGWAGRGLKGLRIAGKLAKGGKTLKALHQARRVGRVGQFARKIPGVTRMMKPVTMIGGKAHVVRRAAPTMINRLAKSRMIGRMPTQALGRAGSAMTRGVARIQRSPFYLPAMVGGSVVGGEPTAAPRAIGQQAVQTMRYPQQSAFAGLKHMFTNIQPTPMPQFQVPRI